jgi:drug/metabolite transporter (DMT)-like permease
MDSESFFQTPNKTEKKVNKLYTKKVLGYILLLFVILITVLSSIWIQDISANINTFLLTYINYSFLSLFILFYHIKQGLKRYFKNQASPETVTIDQDTTKLHDKAIPQKVFYTMCIILMIFWYFGNAFYNLGLTKTSITSSNALSNTAILFILFEKAIFFRKRCSVYKIVGVTLCTTGIALMTYYDSLERRNGTKGSIIGDIYIVLGALFYSFYANSLKYYSKRYKAFDMTLVFGYIGLFNMLIIPLVLLTLHLTGIEVFVVPSWHSILYIFINALVAGFISDFFLANTIILLAPHIVSFGMTLTIPLSYLFDFYKDNVDFSLLYLVSTLIIFLSFTIIFIESYQKYQKKKQNMKLKNNTT